MNSLTAPEPRPSAEERDARTEELRKRATARGVWFGLGWTGICCALELIGWGGTPVLFVVFVGGFALLGVAAISGTLAIETRRRDGVAARLFRSLGWMFLLFVVTFPLTSIPRTLARGHVRDRAEPLIAAIEAYETRHGQPPPALDALVPEFLADIPATGRFDSPSFEYRLLRPTSGELPAWRLAVDVSTLLFGPWLEYTPATPDSQERGRWNESHW